ncbi:MAG: twin-arginine translocation signal domain-containing protein [bacterium]
MMERRDFLKTSVVPAAACGLGVADLARIEVVEV